MNLGDAQCEPRLAGGDIFDHSQLHGKATKSMTDFSMRRRMQYRLVISYMGLNLGGLEGKGGCSIVRACIYTMAKFWELRWVRETITVPINITYVTNR